MLADRVFDENFEVPLTVYAREETLRAVQEHLFNGVIWPDFSNLPSAENPMLRYQVCSPGDTVTIGHRDFYAVDVMHTVPSLGFHCAKLGRRVRGQWRHENQRDLVAGAERLRRPACSGHRSFVPGRDGRACCEAGHYTPKSLTDDLKRLEHEPEIWLTGMKPGEEDRIFEQVTEAAPGKNIQMLSRGTILTV